MIPTRCERGHFRPNRSPRLIAGVLIVFVGVMLLLERMGVVEIRDWTSWWPLFLILPGLIHLAAWGQTGRQVVGVILTALGCLFLGNNLGYFHVSLRDLWPVFLIGLGSLMILRTLRGPKPPSGDSSSFLNETNVFGGGKRTITSKTFQGGELMAVFGGHEIDLRDAEMEGDHAVLRVTVVFGGAEIRVPRHWDVVARGTPVFGGLEDKTGHPKDEDGKPAKHLIVDAIAVFGGVEIGN